MSVIKAFKGFRPLKELAAKVASRPYDVMNREEAKAEAAGNPYSFLHIIRSEIDLPDVLSPYDDWVYDRAKNGFESFVEEGVFIQDEMPCLYVYAQVMNGKQQTGIVACTSIDDYLNDVIKKHEFTRPAKEKDRITHFSTTRLHSGPVLSAYPQVDEVDEIVETITQTTPEYDFISDDGIRHIFWVINEKEPIQKLITLFKEKVPAIYIADGHHRAASSVKVGLALRETAGDFTGNEEYNCFLSVLFPDNQLSIIDYNRVIKDLNGLSETDFIDALKEHFIISPQTSPFRPNQKHIFGMYLNRTWYKLEAKAHTFDEEHPISCLDITVLSDYVLDPILHIKDQRTDERIDFVGGIRGLEELEKRVNSGEMKLAFAIPPVSVAQLIRVANSGQVMPPKSTWFEPKLRSGLVVHRF